ncbi:MAG: type IV toxin-antitoxin system AbiEi family antitoxin [Candidatus Thiodiazotropha sp.]
MAMGAAPGKRANREAEILQAALKVFHNTTGLQLVIEAEETTDNAGHQADALLRLDAPGVDRQFIVEVKPRLTQAALGMVVQQLERFPQKGLVVTDYVNPMMAERLKAMDMPFLDAAGNAYLNAPPVYVYIKGNKPIEKPHRKPPTRAFQPTGLKVLFALLCRPGLENAPYRDIAKAAGVALGTVGWVITDLKGLGYLVDMGKRGRRLTNKERLIQRWVTTYPELLRPKLVLGHYRAVEHDWWKQARPHNFQACWGGEVAAAKLTKYLRPERATLYTRGKPGQLLLTNRLKKDPDGDVEILEAFWQIEFDRPHPELAPPLLIYADLMASGEDRNIETARMIYERELAGLIRED